MIHRIRYYADFVVYPALILWMAFEDRARLHAHPVWWVTWFTVGVMVWTLAEYWVHRSLLHGPYWMGIHEFHHKHPKHLTVFPWYQIPGYFLAIFVAVWLVAGERTVAVYSGIVLGYVWFFVMHHTLHHFPGAFPEFAIRHNAHHKLTNENYGVTTDFWDRVFRTYRGRPPGRSAR